MFQIGRAACSRLVARLGFERTARRPLEYKMPDGTLVGETGDCATGRNQLPTTSAIWGPGAATLP